MTQQQQFFYRTLGTAQLQATLERFEKNLAAQKDFSNCSAAAIELRQPFIAETEELIVFIRQQLSARS